MLSPNSFLPRRSVRKLRLSCDGGGAEIAEHLADQIEHGGGLQDHGVAAGGDFRGIARQARFFAGAAGQRHRIDGCMRYGRSLGPTGAIAGHGGDGELRHGFRVPGGDAARVEDRLHALAGGVNAGRGLPGAFDDADGFGHCSSAMLGRCGGGGGIEAPGFGNRRGFGERQQIRIGRGGSSQREGLLHRGANRIGIEAIGGGARGSLIERPREPRASDPVRPHSDEWCCWRSV